MNAKYELTEQGFDRLRFLTVHINTEVIKSFDTVDEVLLLVDKRRMSKEDIIANAPSNKDAAYLQAIDLNVKYGYMQVVNENGNNE